MSTTTAAVRGGQDAPSSRPGTRTHRPTTYSGISPSAQPPAGQPPNSSQGPPIPPPPRTSSQRQTTTSSSSSERGRRSNPNVSGGQTPGSGRKEREGTQAASNGNGSARGASAQRPASSRRAGEGASQAGGSERRKERDDAGRSDERHMQSQTVESTQTSTRGTRKELRFGDYILGQTLGEGEFGKVKLGWRRDGGVQVRSQTQTPIAY